MEIVLWCLQEVCYTQTFPPWSVMTMSRSTVGVVDQSESDEAEPLDDEYEDILVLKGCVNRHVSV